MRRQDILFWALFLAGVAVVVGYYFATRPGPQTAPPAAPEVARVAQSQHAGPVLEITVAGQANGTVDIQLFEDVAPGHVERLVTLAREGRYDNVAFHRVIDGFMAQTGDVKYGVTGGDYSRAGMGGSDLPDLKAEFSDIPFERGIVGMARASDPDSANSQFFIMFAAAPHLNGQYTVVGKVTKGMDVIDRIKRGEGQSGRVRVPPDVMTSVKVIE